MSDTIKQASDNLIQTDEAEQEDHSHNIPTIRDPKLLRKYGIIKAPISSNFDISKWAEELSQTTPLNFTSEGDNEYVFYRNILDEPGFPFDDILNSSIGEAISNYFANDVKDIHKDLRLDDAFCIHYNTTQSDTTCSKHMDPSDITVNLCLEKSDDVVGSEVLFYGTQSLCICDSDSQVEESDEEEKKHEEDHKKPNFQFLVEQEAGIATIHFGCHPHQTMQLKSGRRTNIVLTYWYTDESKSGVAMRTCFF